MTGEGRSHDITSIMSFTATQRVWTEDTFDAVFLLLKDYRSLRERDKIRNDFERKEEIDFSQHAQLENKIDLPLNKE